MEIINNILTKLTTGELILIMTIIAYILFAIIKAITMNKKTNNLLLGIIKSIFKIENKEESDKEDSIKESINDDIEKQIENQIHSQSAFDHIDFTLYNKIPTYEYGSSMKNSIYRKYFTMLGKTFKSNIKTFSQSRDFININSEELSSTLIKLINSSIYEAERKMELEGIPLEIIRIMKIRNNQSYAIMTELVEKTCKSMVMFSTKPIIKMHSSLNIISIIIESIIEHSVEIVKTININYDDIDYNDFND